MEVKVSRVFHAGYVFESSDTRIIFDPLFENPFSFNCFAFPDVNFDHISIRNVKFDAIFISHYHDDHCSFESLNLLDRKTPLYIYCLYEEMFEMLRELGFKTVMPLELNVPVKLGGFTVTAHQALDPDVDCLFHIQTHQGVNILNVVDSWIDLNTLDRLKKFAPWDLVLWPFQTLREVDALSPNRAGIPSQLLPPEWLEQIESLKPRYIVPSSCQFRFEEDSWLNSFFFPISYATFEKQVTLLPSRPQVLRLNPSQSVEFKGDEVNLSAPLSWVQPKGPQNVDYQFDSRVKPKSLADIARGLPSPNRQQEKVVLSFCQNELSLKYSKLEHMEDAFFSQTRIWRLSVFDQEGVSIDFHFILQPGHAEPLFEVPSDVDWTTEIPTIKLFGAIMSGEALSSLMVRLNGSPLRPEIEEELKTADWLEDPLIRCLYDRKFGSYQIAQLKKLKIR